MRAFHWLSLITAAAIPFSTLPSQGIGRLVKKAKDKAAESVSKTLEAGKKSGVDTAKPAGDTTKVAPPSAMPKPSSNNAVADGEKTSVPPSAKVASSAPAVETPLEVSQETLGMFMTVLKADAARHDSVLHWVKSNTAYRSCRDLAMKRQPLLEQDAKGKATTARLTELQARWSAMYNVPPAKRDHFAMDRLSDTIRYVQELQRISYYPVTAKCGTPLMPPTGYEISGQPTVGNEWRPADPSPALPEGMSRKQYALLRERIGAWLMSKQTLGAPLISADETAVLKANAALLIPFTDYFAFKVMPYRHWSDLSYWK